MCMDSWAAPAIEDRLGLLPGCGTLKLALRIEALEDEAAVVAEQLPHADRAKKDDGIVKVLLYPLALTPWTLHRGPFYMELGVFPENIRR